MSKTSNIRKINAYEHQRTESIRAASFRPALYAPRMRRHAPPTIADLCAEGVAGAWVWCNGCRCAHHVRVAFGAMRTAPGTPFIALAQSRHFVCSACGYRGVHLMPDWPPYRAQGGDSTQLTASMPRRHEPTVCNHEKRKRRRQPSSGLMRHSHLRQSASLPARALPFLGSASP